jgi:hypothetical protein
MIGFDSVGTTFNDFKPVPLCDPSHNGCFLLNPHVHQEYGLSFTASNLMGALPARTGVCTASERARRKATLGARKRCMARTHRVYDDRESDARHETKLEKGSSGWTKTSRKCVWIHVRNRFMIKGGELEALRMAAARFRNFVASHPDHWSTSIGIAFRVQTSQRHLRSDPQFFQRHGRVILQ